MLPELDFVSDNDVMALPNIDPERAEYYLFLPPGERAYAND